MTNYIANTDFIITRDLTIPNGDTDSNTLPTILSRDEPGQIAISQYVLTGVSIPSGSVGDSVTLLGGVDSDNLYEIKKDGTSVSVTNGDFIDASLTFGVPVIAVRGASTASEDVSITLTLSSM